MESSFKWPQSLIPFLPVIGSVVTIKNMHFMPGVWKEETIFMTNNSKIKYEQSQALRLPAQSMNWKGSESLQNNNVYVDKFICKHKTRLLSLM